MHRIGRLAAATAAAATAAAGAGSIALARALEDAIARAQDRAHGGCDIGSGDEAQWQRLAAISNLQLATDSFAKICITGSTRFQ